MKQRALNIKEISVGLDMAKQQLTNIIRDLELGGYLVKVPDTNDKRAVLVSLTPEGKEIYNCLITGVITASAISLMLSQQIKKVN